MRLIVLGDIHGNIDAMNSVVQDAIQTYGSQIDGFVFLGDYSCDFIYGEECVQLMKEIEKRYPIYAIKGNRETGMTDMYQNCIKEGKEVPWDMNSTMRSPLLSCKRMSESSLSFLSSLKENLVINFSNAAPLYLQHKMPLDERTKAYLEKNQIFDILTAHTHEHHNGRYEKFNLFNPGSVGLSDEGKRGADYGVMTWKNEHWIYETKHIEYDYQTAIDRIKNNPLLMENCNGWGEAMIASIETGINVPSLYMKEKDRIAKEYALSNKNEKSILDFGAGRYGNISPLKSHLIEKIAIGTEKDIRLCDIHYKTVDFDEKEPSYPVEPWMYDVALSNVLDAIYELQAEGKLEGKVSRERKVM